MPKPSDDIILFKKIEAQRLEKYYADPNATPYNSPGFHISKSHFANYFEHQYIDGKQEDFEIAQFMDKVRELTLSFAELEKLINRRKTGSNQDAILELKNSIMTWQDAFNQKVETLSLKTQTPYTRRQIENLKDKIHQRTTLFTNHLDSLKDPSGETLRYLHSQVDLSFTTPSLGRLITDLEIEVMNFSKNIARHLSPTPMLNAIREHLSIATLSDLKKTYELQGYGLQGHLFRSGYHAYSDSFFERETMLDGTFYAYAKPLNNPKQAERMVCTAYDMPYHNFCSSFNNWAFTAKLIAFPIEVLITVFRLLANFLLALVKFFYSFCPRSKSFEQVFSQCIEWIDAVHTKYSILNRIQTWENEIQFKHWKDKLNISQIDPDFNDPQYLRALEIFENNQLISEEAFKKLGGQEKFYAALKNETPETIKNLKILRILKDCQLENFLFELGKDLAPNFTETPKAIEPQKKSYEDFKNSLIVREIASQDNAQFKEVQHNPSNHFVSPFEIISEIVFKIDNDGINSLFRKSPLPAAFNFVFCFYGFASFLAPNLAMPLAQYSIQMIDAFNKGFCGQPASENTANMIMGSFLTWSMTTTVIQSLSASFQKQHECLDDLFQDPVKPLFIFTSLVLIGNAMGMAYLPETFKIFGTRYHNYVASILDSLFEETKMCQQGRKPLSFITVALIALKTIMLAFNLVASSRNHHPQHAMIKATSANTESRDFLEQALKALADKDAELYLHLHDKAFAKAFYQDLTYELQNKFKKGYDYSQLTEALFSIYCQDKSYNLFNIVSFGLFPLYAAIWGIHLLRGDQLGAQKWQKLSAQKLLMCLELLFSIMHMLAEFFKCLFDYVILNTLRVSVALIMSLPIAVDALYTKQEMKATHTYDFWKSIDEWVHACHLHYWTPQLFKPIQVLLAKLSYYAATTQDIAPIAQETLKHY